MQFSFFTALTALVGAASALPTSIIARQEPAGGRKVFAHYMLGITSGQTQEQWATDVRDAKASGIDAFVLNAGPSDDYSETQLDNAYAAAEAEGGDFKIFISFDMVGERSDAWSVEKVSSWINKYKDSPAQLKVDGKPFVSTFEGPQWSDNWAAVRSGVEGDIYLVPDFSSVGVPGIKDQGKLDQIDGSFSWDAWAKNGARKTTDSDIGYVDMLAGTGKSYMMAVSPFFHADIPGQKSWIWSSDHLWFDRWQQVLEIQPQFVEILTWNDYGESHYINTQQLIDGEPEDIKRYAKDVPHGALRAILPQYIASYKAGKSAVEVTEDVAVFWYRQTPKAVGDKGELVCQVDGANQDPSTCVEDEVFVMVLATQDGSVNVQIGGQGEEIAVKAGSQLVSLPFDGRTGEVTVSFAGKTGTGPVPISNEAPNGRANFNYFTGSTNA